MPKFTLEISRNRRVGAYALLGSLALTVPQPLYPANIVIPFNPSHFSNPLNINNVLFPLIAGKTLIYRGKGDDGCEEDRMAITNQTKSIAGVTARVVHDQVYADVTCRGRFILVEDTFDWYAQDNGKNVWYLGEDSKDCDARGHCVRDPGSWQAGVNGAQPGLIMLANPRQGDHYQQEYYAGHAEDQAAVDGVNLNVMLTRPDAYRPKLFQHCIKTKETTPLESGAPGYKYYCPNFGIVMEDEKGFHSELVAIR
jgi:hypothetical protein